MTPGTIQGTCFGFGVRSSLPFRYLRGGSGESLEVSGPTTGGPGPRDRLLWEWRLPGEPPFHARLHHDGRRYGLWIEGDGWFVIDPEEPSIGLPDGEFGIRREERLWGIPALLCFVAQGGVPLHAAAIEVGEEALLLAAPGTFGKTTLAAGFVRAGHHLLSEDLTCLRLAPEPAVVPGPAMLRLRRDVGERLVVPCAERLDLVDDRVHLALDGGRGDCRPVPVRAIVFLGDAAERFALEPVPDAETIRNLFVLTFRLPGGHGCTEAFDAMVDLARAVPVWRMCYPRRLDELQATVERVVAGV
jgi:hypothetical protein